MFIKNSLKLCMSTLSEELRNLDLDNEEYSLQYNLCREKLQIYNGTGDTVDVTTIPINSVKTLILISYKDYNNFDWNLQKSRLFVGALTDMNLNITKLAKGLLKLELQEYFELSMYTCTHENQLMLDNKFKPIVEILSNIFQYEYAKQDLYEIELRYWI